MRHPFDLESIVQPAIGGMVRALSQHGNRTEADRLARVDDATNLILAFQPRDALELTLAGQTIMLNEMLADAALDVQRAETEAAKQRARSSAVSIARVVQGHLDRLERRGNQPYQTEVAAPARQAPDESADVAVEAWDRPAVAAMALIEAGAEVAFEMPVEEIGSAATPIVTGGIPVATAAPRSDAMPVATAAIAMAAGAIQADAAMPLATAEITMATSAPLAAAAMPVGQVAPEQTDAGGGRLAGTPEPETSWLDEPFEQWLIQTPADLAAMRETATASPSARSVDPDVDTIEATPRGLPWDVEPALPRLPAGYSPARTLADAAAD